MAADILYVVCKTRGRRLAKRVDLKSDGSGGYEISSYEKSTLFTLEARASDGIVAFGRDLFTISRDPTAAVLRGALLEKVLPGHGYRRKSQDVDPALNSLRGMSRLWISVDCDDIPTPVGSADWLSDIPASVRHLLTLLPPELRGVTCIAQCTGSAGFVADGLMRVRLWFWLFEPVSDLEARCWGKSWNAAKGSKLIDTSIYTPVALNYTAKPVLGPGVRDPVPQRWHFVHGQRDRAWLDIPPEEAIVPKPNGRLGSGIGSGMVAAAPRGGPGFDAWLGRIGSVEDGFWTAINGTLGAAVAARLDRPVVVDAIRAAVLATNPGHRGKETIARYADPSFLGREFDALHKRHDAQRRANEAAAAALFSSLSP
jgi:hypothetical protein